MQDSPMIISSTVSLILIQIMMIPMQVSMTLALGSGMITQVVSSVYMNLCP